ncbi:hypothetical protein LOCC1_G003520 [Lachnellula occidentalis]|uniref:Zn(2)-C6 fungal-type domain-containing protein n=1 Tax=Lachnellula occidentalis TaxID=215460 RepID=A0A8H8RZU7_9HELO|nr:hypothetical protein LOCC1_G003520 [Lachnellula occidentalis]
MENNLFNCRHAGCGKCFARKEHLGRHEKTHDPSNLLQCPACKRNFNRKSAFLLLLRFNMTTNLHNSDSLQRHVIRHGATFAHIPLGRAKRACFNCRVSKLKCDRNNPCFSCVKKGVQCKFQHDGDIQRPSRDASSSTAPGTSHPLNHASTTAFTARPCASNMVDDTTTQQTSLEDPYTRPSTTKPRGLIDWTSVEIRPDPQVPASASNEVDSVKEDAQKYTEIYFKQFHHRWPIEHRVSREYDGKDTDLCDLSIRMIGAWLLGTSESVGFALETHNEVMGHLLTRLCQVTSQDIFQQSLPVWMCHAAVLNITFGLYHGHDHGLSRTIILLNILIAALREVAFFRPATARADEKEGYFVPMRTIKEGERQRLAYALFKLDSYISILRNQPMTLCPEDLHFSLPSTFSLYNTNGLHIWEPRLIDEPSYRACKSMNDLILENTSENRFKSTSHQPLLIEDINLCLCAMQSKIWNHVQSNSKQKTNNAATCPEKESPSKDMERLKSRLDEILAQEPLPSDPNFGHEKLLPYRYYYGIEDHTQAGWQELVISRVKDLLSDTQMLFLLLDLHLSTDIPNLVQAARDQTPSAIEEESAIFQRAREQRRLDVRGWTSVPAARSAICRAIDILVTYQNFDSSSSLNTRLTRNLDPICHIALCTSALVVWAYCQFHNDHDQTCHRQVPDPTAGSELTACSSDSVVGMAWEKDAWIETGGDLQRPLIHGVQICRCNISVLIGMFRACIPEGWGLVHVIAPGVF